MIFQQMLKDPTTREKKTSSTEGNRNQALFGYPMAHIQEASRWLTIV